MMTILGLCLVVMWNQLMVFGDNSQQHGMRFSPRQPNDGLIHKKQQPLPDPDPNLLSVTPQVPNPKATNLEKNLEDITLAKEVNPTNQHKDNDENLSMYDLLANPDKDELDIQLLYDLMRAVEYEANFQLFNAVLRDLDHVAPVTSKRIPSLGKLTGGLLNQETMKNPITVSQKATVSRSTEASDGAEQGPELLINAAGTDSVGGDRKGMVTEEERPIRRPIPLHKRIAVALKGLPKKKSNNEVKSSE